MQKLWYNNLGCHKMDNQLIEQIIGQIRKWKLVTPAILFLEIARPFSFLASQSLILCEPLLNFFYQEPHIADYADLLADRSNIDLLVARLDQAGSHRDGTGKEKHE
jgi:hypothetical protein